VPFSTRAYYTWPVDGIQETACPECDLLLELSPLEVGQRANCPRCGHLITACDPASITRALAFAVAALILLVIASSFPFLELHQSGIEKVMTIPGAGAELYRDGHRVLAGMVLVPIALLPASLLAVMIALLVPLRRGRAAPWLVATGRILFRFNAWSMSEVFIIGVLVSLVKVGELATVVIGVSFWAYAGFVVCFAAAFGSLDRFHVWREIERCQA